MAKQSHNRTDREHRTAMGQLGLKFHKQFFSVHHQRRVCEKAHSHPPQSIHNGCPAHSNGSTSDNITN